MAYYSNHNLAYDFSLFEEHEVQKPYAKIRDEAADRPADNAGKKEKLNIAEKPARRSASKKAQKAKKHKRPRSKAARIALGVIAGLAVVVVIVSIIHGQVQLTELNQEIINARADLAEKQSVYTQLEMKVDASISTAAVEKYALEELHMTKASNSQKEFISLSKGDKAEVIRDEGRNIFQIIGEAISSLWS